MTARLEGRQGREQAVSRSYFSGVVVPSDFRRLLLLAHGFFLLGGIFRLRAPFRGALFFSRARSCCTTSLTLYGSIK